MTLLRDGATLRVFEAGDGLPVVFQHGLGGDEAQVAENFPDGIGGSPSNAARRAARAGSYRPFSIAMFADDVLAAADSRPRAFRRRRHLDGRGDRAAPRRPPSGPGGGPDPGAAGLAVRPRAGQHAAVRRGRRLILGHGPARRGQSSASATAARLPSEAPDNLASLLGFFDRPDAAPFADLLADIAADGPGVTAGEAAALGSDAGDRQCPRSRPSTRCRADACRRPPRRACEITPKAPTAAACRRAPGCDQRLPSHSLR